MSDLSAILVYLRNWISESCQEIASKFYAAGLEAEADADAVDTFNKRIRNAQVEQWNFILVVGDKEKENGTVAVRTRDTQEMSANIYYYQKIYLEPMVRR